MITVRVWDENSPNYSANDFVREYGTNTFECSSMNSAKWIATQQLTKDGIVQVQLESAGQTILWNRIVVPQERV